MKRKASPFVLGITGGVGTGKSTAVGWLAEHCGAVVLSADDIARDLTEQEPGILAEIVSTFGKGILKKDGSLDRKKLGRIVFSDEEKRQLLNDILHPRVREEIRKRTAESDVPLLVVETALPVETGFQELCTAVWTVTADMDTRIKRLAESRGYSEDYSRSIIRRQPPEEEYLNTASRVIENSGAPEDLEAALRQAVLDEGLDEYCRSEDRQ